MTWILVDMMLKELFNEKQGSHFTQPEIGS